MPAGPVANGETGASRSSVHSDRAASTDHHSSRSGIPPAGNFEIAQTVRAHIKARMDTLTGLRDRIGIGPIENAKPPPRATTMAHTLARMQATSARRRIRTSRLLLTGNDRRGDAATARSCMIAPAHTTLFTMKGTYPHSPGKRRDGRSSSGRTGNTRTSTTDDATVSVQWGPSGVSKRAIPAPKVKMTSTTVRTK